MQDGMIRIRALQRHFKMGQEVVRALDGIDLNVEEGELLGITGPSGSGKSTLLYLLGGLDHPTAGRIWVQEREITTLDEDDLAEYRRQSIGFVFQMFNLIPTMTALENVEFPLLFSGMPHAHRQQRATELLELVGLGNRVKHRPTELSGGQQQRVAIARSLVHDPPLLLADEPTGNLDSHSGGEVMEILQTLNQQGRTVVVVSHDPEVIAGATRSIRLYDGKIATDAPLSQEQPHD
jgi:putative ABC transport system ATP-binding protein